MSKDKVTKILFFQGDSVIRYFEITPEPPFVHYINTFQTPGEIEKNDSLFCIFTVHQKSNFTISIQTFICFIF